MEGVAVVEADGCRQVTICRVCERDKQVQSPRRPPGADPFPGRQVLSPGASTLRLSACGHGWLRVMFFRPDRMLSMHHAACRTPKLSAVEEVIQTLGMTDPRVAMRQAFSENEVLALEEPFGLNSCDGLRCYALSRCFEPAEFLCASHD